ncbi:excalibur calcium-binding domain-containing protein [Micromonospora sp. NPDC005652]|uniref:excalibur calcium-binding domain-containing protein n=1 Tax=Micromonospora sp. NPDC005652 TaxID=3157046 RepID=UPI00340595E4
MANTKPPSIKKLGALLASVALVGCCCIRSCDTDPSSTSSTGRAAPAFVAAAPSTPATTAPSADAATATVSAAPSSAAAKPKPKPSPPTVRYVDCAAVRRAGAAPLRRGEPGYRSGLDRDGDGRACESSEGGSTGGSSSGGSTGGGSGSSGGSVYYANCSAVRAAGKAPLHRGDPGYSRKLDRDGDGTACE